MAMPSPPPPPAWLTRDTLNPNLLTAQYAVRGEMVLRANAHQATLASSRVVGTGGSGNMPVKSSSSLPFSKLTFCNIGNPQELGQRPITFFRQVTSLLSYPELIDHPAAPQLFPADALERARSYMRMTGGSGLGAYTHSQGLEGVRKEVAGFISRRDGGIAAHAADIFLTDGVSCYSFAPAAPLHPASRC